MKPIVLFPQITIVMYELFIGINLIQLIPLDQYLFTEVGKSANTFFYTE